MNTVVRLWPLYLGECFVLLAVVLGVRGAAGPAFPYFPFILAAPLACSLGLLLRHLRVDNETGIYALLLITVIVWFVGPLRESLIARLQLSTAAADFGLGVSILLLCLSIGLAGVATTDAAVSFVIVPGLSAFGTCGNSGAAPSFLAAFLLFVFAAVFVLAFQHILAKTTQPSPHLRPPQSARRALLFASLFSLLLFLSAHVGTRLASRSAASIVNNVLTAPTSGLAPRLPLGLSFFHDEPLRLGSTSPPPSERVAFRVRSETPLLWRLAVYNEYTGKSWRALPLRSPRRIPDPSDFAAFVSDPPLKGQLLHQTYLIRSLLSNGVIGPATPVSVQGISSPLLLDASGCIEGDTPTYPGATYAVTSLVASPSPDQLRQVAPQYLPAFLDHYLRLPHSAYRISRIAQQVAGDQPTTYDKILALQRYLEQNFTYTLRPPSPPRNRDFVTWFLTDAKAGYCEAFASALVVMARSLGIPARLATGFAPGEFDRLTSTFIVREKDAHAWAEIYFGQDYAWLPFDPQPIKEDTTLLSPSSTTHRPWRLHGQLSLTSPANLVVALILLCAFILLAGPLAIQALSHRRPRPVLPLDERGRICQLYASMSSSLASVGLPRFPSQTPLEYLAHVSHRLRYTSLDILTNIHNLTHLFLLACYSPTPLTSHHLQTAAYSLETVRRSIRLLRSQR